jgi:signal transduction histidine kinase
MLRSLQSRLFFSYLLIAALMLTLMVMGLILLLRNNPIADQVTYRRLGVGLPFISRREGGSLGAMSPRELEQAVERLDQVLGNRIFLLHSESGLVADSRAEQASLPPEVANNVLQQEGLSRGRYTADDARQWLYVSQRLSNGYVLVVAAQRPRVPLLASLQSDDLLRPLMQAGVIALGVSIVLSYLIARWIAKPLDHMAQAARAVAAGEYKRDLISAGPREVASLARAFNEMISQVEAGQKSQRDFVANVSHELKTPLTSIQGFAQAILDGTAEDIQSQQHAARVIFDESDRLKRLVEDLLDLARIDAGQIDFKRERVDLVAIIRNVVERLNPRAQEAQVGLEVLLPALPGMVGDGDRLAQVFTNLVDNAIKHSPARGRVLISGEISQGWTRIDIEDQGPGIPTDELARIFERFYQMDKARTSKGVGLGLPISQEIIRNHHGEILVESSLGRGSRFSVRLPLTLPDDSTLQSTPAQMRGRPN